MNSAANALACNISIIVERVDDTLRVTVSGAQGYAIDVAPGVNLQTLD